MCELLIENDKRDPWLVAAGLTWYGECTAHHNPDGTGDWECFTRASTAGEVREWFDDHVAGS